MEQGRALIAAAQVTAAQRLKKELERLSLPACCVSSAQEARTALEAEDFSMLLIMLPLPGDGTQLALYAARNTACAVLLIDRAENAEEGSVLKARQSGALFLPKPLSRERLAMALEDAAAIHRRIVYLHQEKANLERKMQEIGTVERAKYLLMQTLGMTEAQAHRLIEKQAMDDRQTRAEVALRILKTYGNP